MRQAVIFVAIAIGCAQVAHSSERWFEMPGGSWHPLPAATEAMDLAFRPVVETMGKDRGSVSWQTYRFQYQGRVTPAGKKYIYVNAFCDDVKLKWPPLIWVEVFDGGACFFHGKFDPVSSEAFDVVVNGLA